MELIRRIVAWTPVNVGVAFLLASFISALFVMTAGFALIDNAYALDWEWWSLLPFGLWTLMITPLVGAFIGLFCLLPSLALKRWWQSSWTWLVAGGWSGTWAAVLAALFASSEERVGYLTLFYFAFGALSGTIWWHFARNLIRRDLEAG